MSTSTQNLLVTPDKFGALYIVGNFAAVLFGLSNVQVLIYFRTRRDTKVTFLKLVIIYLWVLDGLHLALIIHSVYYYLVTDNAIVTDATPIVWSFKLQILLNTAIIYVVHLLEHNRDPRVRCLHHSILGSVSEATYFLYDMMIVDRYRCRVMDDLVGIVWMTYMTLGTITVVDVVLASSLCYFLATSRAGFSSTDSILIKLIVYTINTGCLTSVFSIIGMITCAATPGNFIFLGFELLIAKLYVNSFLAFLNAQYYLQPDKDNSTHRVHPRVSRPGLHTNKLEDGSSKTFGTAMFKHLDEEVMNLTRPVQGATK